jgi:uncharacterized surface protein with fasciclin (FAS1) repeats
MKSYKSLLFVALIVFFTIGTAQAQCSGSKSSTSYNGAYQEDPGNVVDIAASDANFSTLVDAVKAAELVEALKADGPITVFAPTNAAFSKVPPEKMTSLLLPKNKNKLSALLTYHVLDGGFDAAAIMNAIKLGGGSAMIKTMNGGDLTAMIMNNIVVLKDAGGNLSAITQTDLKASNGFIHVIDSVVMPK